jgi:16S rRNA (guanine966-N2)-methyltransferase
MRIIAGEFRGRRIEAPDTDGTRPMLDRVRESVFATLGNVVDGAHVLDLYAGSGSLGLEALSRGAEHVRFVEQARVALDALKANVEELGVDDRVRIVRGNALARGSWRDEEAEDGAISSRYDLIVFDPPYRLLDDPNDRAKLLKAADELIADHLNEGGVFVFHAPDRALNALRLPSGRTGDLRTYGTSAILYLWKHAGGPGPARAPGER